MFKQTQALSQRYLLLLFFLSSFSCSSFSFCIFWQKSVRRFAVLYAGHGSTTLCTLCLLQGTGFTHCPCKLSRRKLPPTLEGSISGLTSRWAPDHHAPFTVHHHTLAGCVFACGSSLPGHHCLGDCELLAIKLALKDWHHWLQGGNEPFTVWMDHQNLIAIQQTKQLNPLCSGPYS